MGGAVGMTPTSAYPKPFVAQAHSSDAIQDRGGGPPGLGKVKDKQALADADPLGIDPNVSFDGVGGLDGHINQLKEMVALPLLYPEVFQQFKITPHEACSSTVHRVPVKRCSPVHLHRASARKARK